MGCFYPLKGVVSPEPLPNGKKDIKIIKKSEEEPILPGGMIIGLPCGQCIGCRLDKSRDWAQRMVHEASLHMDNVFITLTYAPEYLPPDGGLKKKISEIS